MSKFRLPSLTDLYIPQSEWEDGALDLKNTPRRIAKMYREELLSGYKPGAYARLVEQFTCFPSYGNDPMVFEGPISFYSLCAHHLLPFGGDAFFAYIPGPLLIGASKAARVVSHYSHMLQIQERMASQIADFIKEHAKATIVIVLLKGKHLCTACRGIKQERMELVNTAVRPQPGSMGDSWRGVADEFYQQLALVTRC